jgi:hypothetical protein
MKNIYTTMKLKYNDKEIELIYSFRANIYFEQINQKNIDISHLSANDVITLFYCHFIASLQKVKEPMIDMVTFLDVVDDNGGEKCVIDFTNWLVNAWNVQAEIIQSMDNDEKVEEPAKDGKKKKA